LQDIQDPSSVFARIYCIQRLPVSVEQMSTVWGQALPQPSWYLDAAGMIGQGFASAAQGVKNAAYSFLDEHINTYPGALTGYGGVGLPGFYQSASRR
jgi:hypothetical protein